MTMSLEAFALEIAHLGVKFAEAQHHALDEAARIIQEEAKAEIGSYQAAAGPFAAWNPLAQATVDDRVSKGFSADEPLLRTGDLRDSIERTVRTADATAWVGSNSDIAVWQEFGTNKIPPRSFLGGAAVRKGREAAIVLGSNILAPLIGPGRVVGTGIQTLSFIERLR